MPELITSLLVIEDDRQIRRIVQSYLEKAGYQVLAATDGIAGLALAQHEKPALIILDLMLPGLDGWEITRRLRQSADPAVATVHIIMLTARVDEADWWRACRQPCAAFAGCQTPLLRRCLCMAVCILIQRIVRQCWMASRWH
jgi:CheY-like chemotaxis protein